ncbi:alpha/beta hydrolase [Chromobacterium vaccinii]|uniref:alpha/beta hydrolase n=1 Tax=Chromobacterium vaccinii TaxID=1108595 RepID=UPI000B067347|nr:alpha/beta hydrolase [Chromobacterium vaccinii]
MGKNIENLKVEQRSLTPSFNGEVKKIEVKKPPKVFVFFIGGAGDRRSFMGSGPNYNVQAVTDNFSSVFSKEIAGGVAEFSYNGYYEVHGKEEINALIDKVKLKKSTKVYIVGHSLGGWNGAHLSQKLSERGFSIEMLITLDPVGENPVLKGVADIYAMPPEPVAKYWLNIHYEQSNVKGIYKGATSGSWVGFKNSVTDVTSNIVAETGRRWMIGPDKQITPADVVLKGAGGAVAGRIWDPKRMPDLSCIVDIAHVDTLPAMKVVLSNGKTGWQMFESSVRESLGE